MSIEAFEAFIEQDENHNKRFEYIGGKAFEVPSNPYVSMIAGLVLTALNIYLRDNPIGYVTGADGGYQVAGELYAPDVAFISKIRQPELPRKGFSPHPPDLAVEVISDTANRTEQNTLRIKVNNYLSAGAMVWVVNPDERTVEVYRPGQSVQVKTITDVIDGGDTLPGLMLNVHEIFPS